MVQKLPIALQQNAEVLFFLTKIKKHVENPYRNCGEKPVGPKFLGVEFWAKVNHFGFWIFSSKFDFSC